MIVFPVFRLGETELLYSLKDMDLDEVLVICRQHLAAFCGLQRNYLVDDFGSLPVLLERIADWCRAHRRTPRGVLGIDDETHFRIGQAVAQRFGLSFYHTATLDTACNKFLMKQQFARHGVPTSRFTLLGDLDTKGIQAVGFPSVLKPMCGCDSSCVFLNRGEEELARNFARLRQHFATLDIPHLQRTFPAVLDGRPHTLDPRREFVLEAHVGGDEYSCDFVVQRGHVQLLRAVRKYRGAHLGQFGGFYLLNLDSLAACGVNPEELRDVCGRIALAFGISDGVCMVDFKLDGGALQVLETSLRPGLSAFVALMQILYGYSSLGTLLRLRLGQEVRVTIPPQEGLCVQLHAPRAGRITTLDLGALHTGEPPLDVLASHGYNQPGDRLVDSAFDHLDLLVGYVLLRVTDHERVPDLLEEVRRRARIEVSDR